MPINYNDIYLSLFLEEIPFHFFCFELRKNFIVRPTKTRLEARLKLLTLGTWRDMNEETRGKSKENKDIK